MSKAEKREAAARRGGEAGRRRGRGGTRPPHGQKEPRKSIAVVTEGEKTEQNYLRWLNARVPGVQIQGIFDSSSPGRVVERAVHERNGRDQVWAFMDVDEHADLLEALAKAKRQGIEVALSGLCFETWLLMHIGNQTQPFARPSDAKNAWMAATGGPRKSDQERLAYLEGHLEDALKRAAGRRRVDVGPDGEAAPLVPRHQRNPSTEVDLFIEAVAKLIGVKAKTLYDL